MSGNISGCKLAATFMSQQRVHFKSTSSIVKQFEMSDVATDYINAWIFPHFFKVYRYLDVSVETQEAMIAKQPDAADGLAEWETQLKQGAFVENVKTHVDVDVGVMGVIKLHVKTIC